jgi:hypothetical protein
MYRDKVEIIEIVVKAQATVSMVENESKGRMCLHARQKSAIWHRDAFSRAIKLVLTIPLLCNVTCGAAALSITTLSIMSLIAALSIKQRVSLC